MSQILYFGLLALCWIYASYSGGPPERAGATILGVGSLLSLAALSSPAHRFGSVEIGIFFIDVVALLAFLALAFRAERYWPLWIAGLQIIGVAGHAVKLVDPGTIPKAYAFIMAFWSYPMLLLIAWGTWRHQRRLAKFGVDKSWSSSWRRSAQKRGIGPTA